MQQAVWDLKREESNESEMGESSFIGRFAERSDLLRRTVEWTSLLQLKLEERFPKQSSTVKRYLKNPQKEVYRFMYRRQLRSDALRRNRTP